MKFITFLVLCLFTNSSFASPYFDLPLNFDDTTVVKEDLEVQDEQMEAAPVDVNSPQLRVLTTTAKITGSDELAKLELKMSVAFDKTGKTVNQIADDLTNTATFNSMAERVRSVENGSAYQETIGKGTLTNYTLTTEAWGYKLGMKFTAGTSRTKCTRVSVSEEKVSVECNDDTSHAGTKEMMKNSYSLLTCTGPATGTVICSQTLIIEPYEFSYLVKYMSAKEIAFRSGIRAIRTNMGIYQKVLGKTVNNAYSAYKATELEKKVNKFSGTFSDEKKQDWSFTYP